MKILRARPCVWENEIDWVFHLDLHLPNIYIYIYAFWLRSKIGRISWKAFELIVSKIWSYEPKWIASNQKSYSSFVSMHDGMVYVLKVFETGATQILEELKPIE